MNTFTQSQKKFDKPDIKSGYVICVLTVVVTVIIVLGSLFAKALDQDLGSCEVQKIANEKHHPYEGVCKS